MSGMALCPRPEPRYARRDRPLCLDVRDLREQPSRGLQRQRGPDRGQQGRPAGAGGDGADLRRDYRRHRPLGRGGVRADQLPRVVDRRRNAMDSRARRRGRSPDRPRLRRDQRPCRHCRAPAADRDHHRHRRGLLRPRARSSPDARRGRLRAPRRRADRPRARRPAGEPAGARRGRPRRLGPIPSFADRAGGLRGRLLGAGRLHVGGSGRSREILRLRPLRPRRVDGRPVPDLRHLFR